jgi:YcxB-like protein
MNLSYSLSKDQLMAFNRFTYRRLGARRGAKVANTILSVVIWVSIAVATGTFTSLYKKAPALSTELNTIAFLFALSMGGLIAGIVYQQRSQRNAVFGEGSMLRRQQSVAATSDGLDFAVPGARTHYDWSRFVEVFEDSATIYLYLDSSHGLVIPKTAFASADELQQFVSWAKSGAEASNRL